MKNNSNKPHKDNSVIKIGIDLGTTNSEIAVNVGGDIEIVKNAQQAEYTPSVFGVDKAGNKVVGLSAYNKLSSSSEDEIKNNKAEIKRHMGTSEVFHFPRLDKDLTPEEISSEILKSLKEDVTRKYPDVSTFAAVITVPASFSVLQAEATNRAGQLAGFRHVVLLQEPIAAAMAYGFDNAANQNWLVYDLGGGTFDVALISSKDGTLTVLGHSGDNFLGGKNFDWKIVDEFIKPAILEKYKFTDFERNNEKHVSVFQKLKSIAEKAKIELSQLPKATVEVDNIGKVDEDGNEVYLSLTLERKALEELIAPQIQKTIDLAKKTLKESGIQTSSVTKIVLVGGPTQIPFVRSSLEKEFNLKIDNTIDPLTVVARGACIFGLSQQIPQEVLLENRESDSSEKQVTLNYDSMTADDEQTVTGIIEELRDSDQDYFIQIQSDSGFYTSSKIKLRNGKFFDTVAIEKGKSNVYWLYLFDDEGNTIPLFPDSFSVTHGLTVSGSPIPHDIGVIYAKKGFDSGFQMTEVCDPYFKKNSIPPLKETKSYKTIKKLEKGKEDHLPIKVYEGESANPQNNLVLTTLKIDGKKLPYDLPAGTDINITISQDESRSVLVEAYIPSIELTLNIRADDHAQSINTADLEKELAVQRERLKKVEKNVSSEEYSKLENTIEDVATNVKNSKLDTDDKNKAERDLRELKTNLDAVEQSKAMPQLKDEFYEKIINAKEVISELEEGDEKQRASEQIADLEKEGEKAVRDEDKTLLLRVNEQIEQTTTSAVFQNPAMWVYMLNQIKDKRSELQNTTDADYFIDKADKAVQSGDVDELKRCVRSLIDLLPKESQEEINASMAGITK